MEAPHETPGPDAAAGHGRYWLAIALLVVGLLGHVLAARAMGGYRLAYTHHVAGFFIILAVTGGVIALLGWRFWRTRRDTMWVAIGAVQALFGALIYASQIGALGRH